MTGQDPIRRFRYSTLPTVSFSSVPEAGPGEFTMALKSGGVRVPIGGESKPSLRVQKSA